MKHLGLLFLMILASLAVAQEVRQEAVGYGINRQDALLAAKREALAQGIGQILTSQTEVENFMVKRDYILTRTMGHVKSFQILEETQEADGAWRVKISAVLAEKGLAVDLAALNILMQDLGNPRVAVLIQERHLDMYNPATNNAEMILLDFLKNKDFRVVDPNKTLRFKESPEGLRAMEGDPTAAAKLGSLVNAEVVIVGTAMSSQSDVSDIQYFRGSGMKSASATISLKAFNVGTREILAAKSMTAAMVNVNLQTACIQAVQKATQQILNDKGGFFESLVENWRRQANDGQTFQLSVKGMSSYALLKQLKNALQNQAKVQQRSFQQGVAQLELTRAGTAEDLCELLDGLKVGEKKLMIQGMQGNTIQAILQ